MLRCSYQMEKDMDKTFNDQEIVGTIENNISADELRDFGIRSEQLSVEFNDKDNYDFED